MKLAIISDIHANLPALQSVIKDLERRSYDKIINLGDNIGYGPYPNEVLDLLREYEIESLLGNHDAGVIGKQSLSMFREPNRSLLEWTKVNITPENFNYLSASKPTITADYWLAAHASPINPLNWEYIDSAFKGREILEKIDYEICFVGHTHKPAIISNELGVFEIEKGYKYIINPGSVGQSRDKDNAAAYGIFDFNKFSYEQYKIEYPIEETFARYEDLNINYSDARRLLNFD